MSMWTHVAGCIRLDSLRFTDPDPTLEYVKQLLGTPVNYHNMDEYHPDNPIPCGSEGTLNYHVQASPSKHDLAAYAIVIWGDLRDYSDIKEIEDWFNKIVNDETILIRQAIITIECEDGRSKVCKYEELGTE